MSSLAVVEQFQFVLRFDDSILGCSSLSCGTFTSGSDWAAFGDKVAYSPDEGQVKLMLPPQTCFSSQ